MLVTVKFIGTFRSMSGKSKLCVKINDAISLREFIKTLVEKQPQLKNALINPELEDPKPKALILVNGKEISVLNGLDTMLDDEAEVVFVPVVHGG
jgi:molybdopterin converting factor small subunit